MKRYKSEREMQQNRLLKDGDYTSIKDMLCRLAKLMPQQQILAWMNTQREIEYINARELLETVSAFGDGLLAMGLEGSHIAIIADNSCRYVIADMSISSGVGIVTPIDKDAPPQLMAQLLDTCDADVVLCSAHILDRIKEIQPRTKVRTIITIDRKANGFESFDSVVEKGRREGNSGLWLAKELDLDAPAKILFTSGTTGPNKGVVLSNANLTANMLNCMDSIRAEDKNNTSMSVLPMHHATEINTHIMARIGSGRLTYINDSIRNMMPNMKRFKPAIITVVPMIANMFYKQILAGAEKAGKEEKLKKGIKLVALARKFGIDISHKVLKDVFEPFGGNLREIVCGGSMLNANVVKGMSDLGIFIVNGYGITECGPLISMNAQTLEEWQSVGKPCPGLEVKLDNPDEEGVGELCVRGKSVAKGYYKDPESTAKVFDSDGFFHTGDSARIDSKGRIFLTGRKKNVIVLENGKNVCPEEIENAIETAIPYVDEVVVYAAQYAGHSLICAGLWIQDDSIRADRKRIEDDMKKVNSTLMDYKRVEFVQLAGQGYEKTSTRKIRRDGLPKECRIEEGFAL